MERFENRQSRKEELKSRMISTAGPVIPEEQSEREEDAAKKSRKSVSGFGRRFRPVFIALAVFFALAAIWQLYIRFYRYRDYTVTQVRDITVGSTVGFAGFGGGILKYSKDGVIMLDRSGKEIWVESYGMKDPILSVNGDYAVIADRDGNDIYIFDKNKKLTNLKTVLPITRLTSAANGVCAVISESARAAYVYIYDKSGRKIADLEFLMNGSGYPTDIALSPDGSRLMASLQYIDGDDLRGRVAFYDFSDKGESIQNRLVGGFDDPFGESLIGRVHYLSSIYSCAVADTGLYFFSSKNLLSPEIIKEHVFEEEIRSICKSGENIAVVLNNNSAEYPYRLVVYNAAGERVLSKEFSYEYQYLDMDGGYVFLYNNNSALFYNKSGTAKYRGNIDFQVLKFFKASLPNEFIFVGGTQIKTVKLK